MAKQTNWLSYQSSLCANLDVKDPIFFKADLHGQMP